MADISVVLKIRTNLYENILNVDKNWKNQGGGAVYDTGCW